MDRVILLERLRLTGRYIVEGELRIRRQCQLIAELERDGHDPTIAKQLLAAFERVQTDHITAHDRLTEELARHPK